MKKYLVLAFVVALALTFIACGGQKIGGGVKGQTRVTSGWVDDHTFIIAARGAPPENAANRIVREESARRAAILSAQYQILERFKGSTIEGASAMADFQMTGIAIAQEVEGFIKGGEVVRETFDQEGNCEIICRVRAQGLRRRVEAASWQ